MEQKIEKQVSTYLSSPPLLFLQDLIVDVAKQEPTDPLQFCIEWLQVRKENSRPLVNVESSDEEEEINQVEEMRIRERIQIRKDRKMSRQGVSSEVFGEYNRRESYHAKFVPKNEESKTLLSCLLKKSIFFQSISAQDQKILIDAVEETQVNVGDQVIKEGDTGNLLYIVESGVYECTKVIKGVSTFLKTYQCGDIFGELALLYNAPRAASITCRESGKLFTLDRVTFNMVMTGSANKKRAQVAQTLKKIEIFSTISDFEREQICDVLKEEKYKAGSSVIKQGETGDKFYIIHSGVLVAQKESGEREAQVVYQYKAGDYFGELALLNDVCRQATVKTVSDCVLFSIDRDSFLRLLGSLSDIMERNRQKYESFEKSLTKCC